MFISSFVKGIAPWSLKPEYWGKPSGLATCSHQSAAVHASVPQRTSLSPASDVAAPDAQGSPGCRRTWQGDASREALMSYFVNSLDQDESLR